MKCVNTDKIPSIPNAPFSQGMIVGGLLFMSGQVGTDPATGKLVEGGVQSRPNRQSRISEQFLKALESPMRTL